MLMLFLCNCILLEKKNERRPSLFLFKLIAMVDTCSTKCSVSLARKKIRLDF